MYRLSLISLLACIFTITSAAQEQPVSIETIKVCSVCSVYSRLYGCCWLEPRPGKDVALPGSTFEDVSKDGDYVPNTYGVQQLLGEE